MIHRGRLLGVVPKSYLPEYREYYEKRQFRAARDAIGDQLKLLGTTVPFGADLLFAFRDCPNLVLHVEICEDLWAPIPPSNAAMAGASVLANPLGEQRHDREGGVPPPAVRIAVGAHDRGLSVCGRRRRRVNHGSRVGRPGSDLRER